MSYLIRCSTLFDITATGVRHRTCPADTDPAKYLLERNQQCNFDTVIQSISIRSLPEIQSMPAPVQNNKKHLFGSIYKSKSKCWEFDFTVADLSVWKSDVDDLFYLNNDCHGVPMIVCGTEIKNITHTLSVNPADKNIYFTVISHES